MELEENDIGTTEEILQFEYKPQQKYQYIKNILDIADNRGLYPHYRRIASSSTTPTIMTDDGREILAFCTNNYLGLSATPKVIEAAIRAVKKYGLGCGGARVTSGNLDIHEEFEKRLAAFKGMEDAILFMTGYMANIGVITAFMESIVRKGVPREESEGIILVDRLSHASIFDACKLCRTKTFTYPHKNTDYLEKLLIKYQNKRILIVTDGVFSMDGDIAPLPEIVRLAEKYGAYTMVDDAHASGVLGEKGRGTLEHFGLMGRVDIVMGTLSKSLGGIGGFIAGNKDLIRFLRMISRPYVFSSPLPPAIIGGAMAALEEIENNPNLRKKLFQNVNYMKRELIKLNFNLLPSETPIIPIVIGREDSAIKYSDLLYKKGLFIPAITWPAVPLNTARLRCIVTAAHRNEQILKALKILKECQEIIEIG